MTLPNSDAGVHERDIVRVGKVVAIVAVDLARDEIVLVREFRIGAHLATGEGDLVQAPWPQVAVASIDLAANSVCPYCHSPITMLDLKEQRQKLGLPEPGSEGGAEPSAPRPPRSGTAPSWP